MAVHAWGVDVLNTYAATETATIASMCPMGSLHLYEDFVLVEPVDAAYRAVPDGPARRPAAGHRPVLPHLAADPV